MDLPEKVHLNPDEKLTARMLDVIAKNGGYCPCRLQRTPENICLCAEFRAQISDPEFSGYCHCQLYFKEK